MIKLVLFDLGKVLVDFDFERVFQRFAAVSPHPVSRIQDYFEHNPLWEGFEEGKLSPHDFVAQVTQTLQLKLPEAAFIEIWNDIFWENAPVVELMRLVRRNRYPVYVVSNVNPLHLAHIRQRFSVLHEVDHVVASCEVEVRKPDPAIYQRALDHAQVTPPAAVFVDDTLGHVEAARQLGIHGIHYQDPERLLQEFQQLGVSLNHQAHGLGQ